MLELIRQPWSWYVAGVFIGLTVPILLLIGNKSFGISSSLRHICAACVPAGLPFFKYNWRNEIWNLFFVAGIFLGGFVAVQYLSNPEPIQIAAATRADLEAMGVRDFEGLMPNDVFGTQNIFTRKGLFFMVLGGLLVGFGTRYANGCTSGHAIMGLASLQLASLIATISFMIGGFISAWVLVPMLF